LLGEHLEMLPESFKAYFLQRGKGCVGFHHSGLNQEERDCIELLFKRGILKVIFCTSTLAAGVNLPAKRVIIASLKQGYNSELTSIQYKQMIGRAGRFGFDTEADSIVCCYPNEKARALEMMTRKLERVESCLKGR